MSTNDPLNGCEPAVLKFEYRPGKFIFLRGLDGLARSAYMRLSPERRMDMHEIAALGICKSESDVSPAYDTDEQKQVLARKDGAVLQDIALKILEISGMGATGVDDAEKKSGASPS